MEVAAWVLPAVALLASTSTAELFQSPCIPSDCGENTLCRVVSGRAVCSCLPGYNGSPAAACVKGECVDNRDCRGHKACVASYCKDVCDGRCGTNAKCEVRSHIPVCSCPAGYTGSPFVHCRQFDLDELCNPSPCGQNTKCKVVNNVPICSCLPGFLGSALKGCRPECESDGDCARHQRCSDHRCAGVCTADVCGTGARCTANNHAAVCTCPEGYVGNPQLLCRPECTTNSDCTSGSPVCWYNRCIDPCNAACGQNANCRIRSKSAICSCPNGYTGDPTIFCRPFTGDDYCTPNPCGESAVCQPGYDGTGKRRPVCTCPPGYIGNALHSCRRGECVTDYDCGSEYICDEITYKCRHACRDVCGTGAECVVRNHIPLCSCPPNYTGDPTVACNNYFIGRG